MCYRPHERALRPELSVWVRQAAMTRADETAVRSGAGNPRRLRGPCGGGGQCGGPKDNRRKCAQCKRRGATRRCVLVQLHAICTRTVYYFAAVVIIIIVINIATAQIWHKVGACHQSIPRPVAFHCNTVMRTHLTALRLTNTWAMHMLIPVTRRTQLTRRQLILCLMLLLCAVLTIVITELTHHTST